MNTHDALLQKLEDAKSDFLRELQTWTDDQRSTRPTDGGWSALQVIEHIMWSERGTLGYMMKKTSSGWEALDLVEETHVQSSAALNARLASNERYKAPAVLPDPTGEIGFETMVKDWAELRAGLVQFVHGLAPEFEHRLVFKQPAAGPLTIEQTLQFLYNHIQHHLPQIQRIRAAQGF